MEAGGGGRHFLWIIVSSHVGAGNQTEPLKKACWVELFPPETFLKLYWLLFQI